MGFESFSKKGGGVYRANKEGIIRHAQKNAEYFRTNIDGQLPFMFNGVTAADISPEEKAAVEDWVAYASKRVAAGAVSSRAYHTHAEDGDIAVPLKEWAPEDLVGHDSVHAAFAYSRTKGRSLVPAYEQVGAASAVYQDPLARLEEAYVFLLSDPGGMRNLFKALPAPFKRPFFRKAPEDGKIENLLRDTGLTDEAIRRIPPLADYYKNIGLWGAAVWEENAFYGRKELRVFAKQHRDPVLLRIMADLYQDARKEIPDPVFSVHQFLRIIEPMRGRLAAERLKAGQDKDMLLAA